MPVDENWTQNCQLARQFNTRGEIWIEIDEGENKPKPKPKTKPEARPDFKCRDLTLRSTETWETNLAGVLEEELGWFRVLMMVLHLTYEYRIAVDNSSR